MPEAQDAENIKAGDANYDIAFIEKICGATWEPLYRFIYHRVRKREEAEDITQETYVKALPHIQNDSSKIDNYSSYLKTVAINILRDRWRRDQRRGSNVNIEDINPGDAAVEDSTESSAQKEVIRAALDQLNKNHRRVIELRILNGYSVAETARIMQETEGNIRVLQYRALQTLSKILKVTD